MNKIKDYIFGILSLIGLVFVFLKIKNQKIEISNETKNESASLQEAAESKIIQAESLDREAKKLDTILIKEDEEWYKKR